MVDGAIRHHRNILNMHPKKRLSNDKKWWPFLVSPIVSLLQLNGLAFALICIFPLNFLCFIIYLSTAHKVIVNTIWFHCIVQTQQHIPWWNCLFWLCIRFCFLLQMRVDFILAISNKWFESLTISSCMGFPWIKSTNKFIDSPNFSARSTKRDAEHKNKTK